MSTMQLQVGQAPVYASNTGRRGWRRSIFGIMGIMLFVATADSLQAQTRWSRSSCGYQRSCQPAACCPGPVQCAPETLHYYCPMYATQQLEGGGGFLYYALEWDLGCNSSTPVAMYGNYATPQFCPNCGTGFQALAAGGQRSGRMIADEFPGYPGPILPESFNPVTARPEDGGFPDTPGWSRPTIVDEKKFQFTDSFGMTVYIKVFSVSLKIREACRAQNHLHCDDMPEYFIAKIGYQVIPDVANDPKFLPVKIEPISRKLVRAYTGLDSNNEESALVILGRGS